jgi:hypothetical protein
VVKWLCTALAVALAITWALSHSASTLAQDGDPLLAPGEGSAGGRFQVVGQLGWTPDEHVTLEFAFADDAPLTYGGPWYHERDVTVLRDGTWSFPIVINDELFPFPLWRPGYIVVRATSGSHTEINALVYTVEGQRPAGLPPLANLGAGPDGAGATPLVGMLLFMSGIGMMFVMSGSMRRNSA